MALKSAIQQHAVMQPVGGVNVVTLQRVQRPGGFFCHFSPVVFLPSMARGPHQSVSACIDPALYCKLQKH